MDNNEFYKDIYNNQHQNEDVPPNSTIADWASNLVCLLFPEFSCSVYKTVEQVEDEFNKLKERLFDILSSTMACNNCNNRQITTDFIAVLPDLYRVLNTDIYAIVNGDPAARSRFEVVRAYPGFYALCFYRIAHALYKLEVPYIPRILTEHAHSKTGIDIHPAAEIEEHFFIDHGTGIVIGETARIGKHVKLYQGVTLGALSVHKNMAFKKRHPTVEDHVVIYSGATILGGETVIGHHSIIGGNVWLTQSVPPGTIVYHNPEIIVEEGKISTFN